MEILINWIQQIMEWNENLLMWEKLQWWTLWWKSVVHHAIEDLNVRVHYFITLGLHARTDGGVNSQIRKDLRANDWIRIWIQTAKMCSQPFPLTSSHQKVWMLTMRLNISCLVGTRGWWRIMMTYLHAREWTWLRSCRLKVDFTLKLSRQASSIKHFPRPITESWKQHLGAIHKLQGNKKNKKNWMMTRRPDLG